MKDKDQLGNIEKLINKNFECSFQYDDIDFTGDDFEEFKKEILKILLPREAIEILRNYHNWKNFEPIDVIERKAEAIKDFVYALSKEE